MYPGFFCWREMHHGCLIRHCTIRSITGSQKQDTFKHQIISKIFHIFPIVSPLRCSLIVTACKLCIDLPWNISCTHPQP